MKVSNPHDSEKWLEREAVKFVGERGGVAIKIAASTINGLPDRLVLWPNAVAEFVEIKTTGKTLSPMQRLIRDAIRSLGFRYTVIDSEVKLQQWQDSTPGHTKPK